MHTRRFPRYAIDRSLTAIVFWEDTPIRKVHGRCRVLGEGGVGATLTDQLFVGEVVRLDMPPLIGVYATVRDTRGTEHGLEFLYSRDGHREAIKNLCAMAANGRSC
ncbi:MAG: PilZ domain-containing protein [Acidobacteriia bacterium]|nr:PilZ domain-containing protein [Terriglobia bacterium]